MEWFRVQLWKLRGELAWMKKKDPIGHTLLWIAVGIILFMGLSALIAVIVRS